MNIAKAKLVISGPIFEYYRFGSLTQELFKPTKQQAIEQGRKRSKQALIRRINANAGQWLDPTGRPMLPQFYTFTYGIPPDTVAIASKDYSLFIKRLNYVLFGTKKSLLKYTTVIEFQEKRGLKYGIEPPIHYHTLFYNLPFIQDIKKVYIDPAWSHGYTFARSVENVLNAGQYIAKYLTKSDRDHRLFNKKSHFSSHGLLKPVVLINEFTIANYLDLLSDDMPRFDYQSEGFEYSYIGAFNSPIRYYPLMVKKIKDIKINPQVIHTPIQGSML
jgi:hypothetical protein